jgi:hypothetical protein
MQFLKQLIQNLKLKLLPSSPRTYQSLVRLPSPLEILPKGSSPQQPKPELESSFEIKDDTGWFLTAHNYRARSVQDIKYAVVHRIDVGDGTPRGIGSFFETYIWDGQLLTGGKMPYHLIIEVDGNVTRCVPYLMIAPGAAGLNKNGIQVGVVGDFRKHPPTDKQRISLLLAYKHLNELYPGIRPMRHDDEPTGTTMKNKVCPGKHLSIEDLKNG